MKTVGSGSLIGNRIYIFILALHDDVYELIGKTVRQHKHLNILDVHV